ncbi:hypothetical protein CHS0354_036203 [Potamilus streckersoni]|uniref:LRRCT domain-containing protein n=1 Tax=Potamilus streckersoni TaxID=2493646 RepID=A0AAE0SVE9_9BIVA|nr:hypothetical protein CHS0354_036203 [Potamilus streckersoni]
MAAERPSIVFKFLAEWRTLLAARSLLAVLLMSDLCMSCPNSCNCKTYLYGKPTTICIRPSSSLLFIMSNLPDDTQNVIIEGMAHEKMLSNPNSSIVSLPQLSEFSFTIGLLERIEDDTFQSFFSLKKLYLYQNQISVISNAAFRGLMKLEELDLSRNKLQHISNEIFSPLPSLQKLDLSENQIKDLPVGVFHLQRNLNTLRLSGNMLGQINASAFRGILSLRELHLQNCALRELSHDILVMNSFLQVLDISNNFLLALPSGTSFQHLQILTYLNFSSNKISFLNDTQFQGLNLEILDLSHNRIEQIMQNIFQFASIRHLDISYNQLRTIADNSFRELGFKLKILNLSGNKELKTLTKQSLGGLYSVQKLNISSCSIKHIDNDIFHSSSGLQDIDISSNQIQYLPSVEYLSQLQSLKLDNNVWNCDCMIRPMREWLRTEQAAHLLQCQLRLQDSLNVPCVNIRCKTPSNLMHRPISTLADSEVPDCTPTIGASAAKIGTIAGISTGMAILMAVMIFVCVLCLRRQRKGQSLLSCCTDDNHKKGKKKKKNYYVEEKERYSIDPEKESLNESDKSFIVRNFFHSMVPDPEAVSRGTPSMTRRGSNGSWASSAFNSEPSKSDIGSFFDGYRMESAV